MSTLLSSDFSVSALILFLKSATEKLLQKVIAIA